MLPCCRPQQLRCFGLRDSVLPLPRVPLLTQLHHVATGPSPRYHGALKFGSLRSQHHIKLPDKLKVVGLLHPSINRKPKQSQNASTQVEVPFSSISANGMFRNSFTDIRLPRIAPFIAAFSHAV